MSDHPARNSNSATSCSQIFLPDISKYTRQYFILKCNPFHQEGERASHAWLDSYEILSDCNRKKFFDSRFCLLASLLYPDADLEHLRPAMDFMLWLFSFDDMADLGELELEGLKQAVDITMSILYNPDSVQPNLRIAATLHSFFNRMRQNGTPTAIRHFIEATQDYTRAIAQEMTDAHTGHIQTFEEYRKCRPGTSAINLTLATLEYAHGINIPDEVLHDPIVSELSLAGNEILTWANDIYSFPREYAGGHSHNLVLIIMWYNQLELQDAVDYVNQLIEQRVQDYLEAKAKLRSFGPDLDEEVTRYIQGIEYCVQACIDWSFITTRYFGADVATVKEHKVVNLGSQFDDMADSGEFKLEGLKRAVDITMTVLQDPDSIQPNLKIAATLHSFFNRMRQNGSPTAIRHFIEATESYTRAITQEMIDKQADHVQTFEEYRKYRPDTSAVKLTLATLEYAHQINIPDKVPHDCTITELSLAGNEILTWANNIYSFPKEYARGHTHNLVFIIMWHNKLELQDAVDYVSQLIERRVQDYLEAKARLQSFGPDLDTEVARYIQGIEYCIQACIDWSFVTTRYFGADVARVKRDGVVDLISGVTPGNLARMK